MARRWRSSPKAAVDRAGRRSRRRDRTAATIADDQPESPSWEGDSRHIVYQTPTGLRRILAGRRHPRSDPARSTWRSGRPPPRLVVHAGHVLDGTVRRLRGETDIVVERGVIRSVEAHRDDLHVGAVVDAGDEFVMPGLIEMHAHLDHGYGENFGRVWLAYGITSRTHPGGQPVCRPRAARVVRRGTPAGTARLHCRRSIRRRSLYYPGGVAIASVAQLDQELDRAASLGVDFFKTYVRLPDALQKRVVDYAHAHDKPVTSHELFPAVAFGVDGVEHLVGASRRGYTPNQNTRGRIYQDVID